MALSTITATTATIGGAMSINIKKGDSAFKHTLEYAFGDQNGTIVEKTNLTSIKWAVPADLVHQLPNSKSGYMTIYCYTYYNNALQGYNYIQVLVNVPDSAKPSVTAVFEEADAKVAAVSTAFLKYVSDVNYTITATSHSGAEIVSYSITNGGVTYSTATGTFTNVTDAYYDVIVTDSRGMFTTERFYKITNDYTRLTCDLETESVDPEDGIFHMALSGNYFNRSFYGGASNSLTIRVECIDRDGNKVTKTATPTFSNHTYTAKVDFEGVNYREVYDITAYASDRVMDAQSKTVSVAGKPLFDWSNEDFRFHIPVTEIDGYPWADFVIETGTEAMGSNGTWYWRKWKSGRAECCGTRNFGRASTDTSINSTLAYCWYRTPAYDQELPTGLFIETPDFIDIKIKALGTAEKPSARGAYIFIPGKGANEKWTESNMPIDPSKDNTGSFCLVYPGPTTMNGETYEDNHYPATHICFNVIGRWK